MKELSTVFAFSLILMTQVQCILKNNDFKVFKKKFGDAFSALSSKHFVTSVLVQYLQKHLAKITLTRFCVTQFFTTFKKMSQ